MASNIFYLGYQIWPYTNLSKHQIKRSTVEDDDRKLTLMIFNVYQDNRDVASCVKCIHEHDPDLVLLVETDDWWKRQLDNSLIKKYEHQLARPLENTYGMLLYSRFQLIDPQIKFLVEGDVPSIHTKVKLPSGEAIRLYGLHPQPPVPGENPRSTERDAEILMVAEEAKNCLEPVIVAGDLNDVAWSYTTELFIKVSRLLDPRRGRGFYNTFHAKHWFFRWPLDHIFCSHHFQLINLKRLGYIGSDHFPILVELALAPEKSGQNKKEILSADRQEEKLAGKKIRSGVA
jgi:endonuclease/exonuclease/phosphatase (EEP) superfamily protein YafD